MAEQIHKKFSNSQVKSLIESYILSILGISCSRFFTLLKNYRQNPSLFSIEYARSTPNRKIRSMAKDDLLAELFVEKCLIEERSNPIKHYNYSYIRDLLLDKYGHKVSVPTIIDRAKRFGFYDKKKAKKVHDR